MSPPRRPSQRRESQHSVSAERNAGTWIGMAAVAFCVLALVGLAGLVLGPWVFAGVGLLGLFAGTIALHYFIWGRWLGQNTTEDERQPKSPTQRQD